MHNVTSFPEKHFPANPNVQKKVNYFPVDVVAVVAADLT